MPDDANPPDTTPANPRLAAWCSAAVAPEEQTE
jgi:hypothetical protein